MKKESKPCTFCYNSSMEFPGGLVKGSALSLCGSGHCCGLGYSLAWELLYAVSVAKKKKKFFYLGIEFSPKPLRGTYIHNPG